VTECALSALDSCRCRAALVHPLVQGILFSVQSCGIGPLWTLHHAAQPKPLRSTSISFVNALGNLGGFVGPYMLGALKAPLGPRCAELVDGKAVCVTQWGGALALIGGLLLLQNVINALVAYTAFLPRLRRQYAPRS